MGESWVGGDIGGLRRMGTTYQGAKEKLDNIVKPLNTAVDGLVGDSGWGGDAAKSFRGAWSEDSMTAGGFAELVHAVGKILSDLADDLGTANTTLQNAEDIAVRAGVPMKDKGVPNELMTNDPPSAAEKKTIKARDDYDTIRTEALHAAQHARLKAADALNKLFDEDTSPLSAGGKVTILDYLRGLYAYDSERTRAKGNDAQKKLDEAKSEENAAKKDWRKERKAWEKEGRKLPKGAESAGAYREAKMKLDGLNGDIAAAENGSSKLPYDRQLNVKVADAAKLLHAEGGLSKLPDFLKEIPVVDVAAAGACSVLEAKEDHDEGWSWKHSLAVDGTANLGGLAAGAALTAGGVALAASAEITVPVAVVAGVGGALVVGATDLIDEGLHEHWSEDIHDHGVLGGILHGSGNVVKNTGEDIADLGKGVWNGVKSLF